MTLTEMFLTQLDREAPGTRRALERVPEGKNDWKPHEKSMPLGYLATMVASMPSWIATMIEWDELDLSSTPRPPIPETNGDLLRLFDESLAKGRRALRAASEDRLMTTWRMVFDGKVVNEQVRHIAISDGVLSHWAHHRGQLTVYLRLNGAAVPSLYGPTADEGGFR